MGKWIKIKPNKKFENGCTEVIELPDEAYVIPYIKGQLNCGSVQYIPTAFSDAVKNLPGNETGKRRLILLIDESEKLNADKKSLFNALATFLFLGPEEMTKEVLPDYICDTAIIGAIENDITPLNEAEIEFIMNMYKTLSDNRRE